MKRSTALITLLISLAAMGSTLPPPLPPGQYTFQHKFAEQPELSSIPLVAQINGFHIVLINESNSAVFPKGTIAEGTLMWHAASGQWIIGHNDSDRSAPSVGGCSDGPEVVDLEQKIYWTC
jgi:hypothetical protein